MMHAHFNVDMPVWIGLDTVAGGLFYELPAMCEDEGLGGIVHGRNAVDEMGEYDLAKLACAVRLFAV